MPRIRVLIADDHRLFRRGLRTLLATEPDFEIVGEAVDGNEAVVMAASLRPDIILMDYHMPGLSGTDATQRVVTSGGRVRIIILTQYSDDERVIRAIESGADGYLLKNAEPSELIDGIRAVARGEVILDSTLVPGALKAIFHRIRQPRPGFSGQDTTLAASLTGRELAILRLIVAGGSNKEIAGALGLAPGTVKKNITGILQKLRLDDRTQAAVFALQQGLLSPPDGDVK